jgi:hypothetical protein
VQRRHAGRQRQDDHALHAIEIRKSSPTKIQISAAHN